MPTLTSLNPYTEEVNATFETLTEAQVLEKIEIAHHAYLSWKETPHATKKSFFLALADLLDSERSECARLETIEMGMISRNSLA